MYRHMNTAFLTAILAASLLTIPTHVAGATIYVTTTTQEINSDSYCSLQEAIYAANLDDNKAPDSSNAGQVIATGCEAGNGADIIELPAEHVFSYADPITDVINFVGPSATPMVTSTITIEGRGSRLERVSAGRPTRAFVVGPTGFLDLREVHVEGFFIHGGDGGLGGGGGGMGAGGAIYVQGGRLLVQWSTFEGNGVRGGDGGDEGVAVDGGGGGGGLSGNGGNAGFSGGGGGGSRGSGGNAHDLSLDYRGGGGGGRVTSGINEAAGQPCGGDGGESGFGYGVSGDSASPFCPGGGGGGGSGTSDLSPGDGGSDPTAAAAVAVAAGDSSPVATVTTVASAAVVAAPVTTRVVTAALEAGAAAASRHSAWGTARAAPLAATVTAPVGGARASAARSLAISQTSSS